MQRTSKLEEKLKIPHALKIKILGIQVENNTDWISACEIAATMLDPEKEKRRITNEARHLMNSEMMKQLNHAKATVAQNAREDVREEAEEAARQTVAEEVRANEDNFRVPCKICGKLMYLNNRDTNWEAIKNSLNEGFKGWGHVACHEKSSVR